MNDLQVQLEATKVDVETPAAGHFLLCRGKKDLNDYFGY